MRQVGVSRKLLSLEKSKVEISPPEGVIPVAYSSAFRVRLEGGEMTGRLANAHHDYCIPKTVSVDMMHSTLITVVTFLAGPLGCHG